MMNFRDYFSAGKIVWICLLLLSLKATSQQVDHWEALVRAENQWSYFLGTSEPPYTWNSPEFDPASWLKGPGGFGYGDNDDATVIPTVSSVYIRHTFQVVTPEVIQALLLYVDFDDGFVAYLNGVEIARANMGRTERPPFNQYALSTSYEAQIPAGRTPARFILSGNHLNLLKSGSNVLALQVHDCNATSSDLSSTTFLIAGISEAGNKYQQIPAWFVNPESERSHLPLVLINTNGQTIVNEPKITVGIRVIDNGPGNSNGIFDGSTSYDGNAGIEIRGQSSQNFPKKSYGVELRNAMGDDVKAELLGMPAESDWVLYAPYSDKTMLRNALTFYLGGRMGRWQPRFGFCEVYLNGDYVGVYLLIEKIKRDKERVPVAKMTTSDVSGDAVTGGYIVKVDKVQDLSSYEYFYNYPDITYPNTRNYAWSWVYPKADDLLPQQRNWFMEYIKKVENSINSSSFTNLATGYPAYLDIPSFIDFQIMNELSNNVDGYRYSTFFHKDRESLGGKLVAGPLWDFNLGYGNVDYVAARLSTTTWLYTSIGTGEGNCMHWWYRLMQDPAYKQSVKERYSRLRRGILHTDSVFKTIDSMITRLGPAVGRNFNRWPVLDKDIWPNPEIRYTYENEIIFLKNWVSDRLYWMDNQWLVPVTGTREPALASSTVYPNPFRETLHIMTGTLEGEVSLEVLDIRGITVFSRSGIQSSQGHISVSLAGLTDGVYFLKLTHGKNRSSVNKIVKNRNF